MTYDINTIDQLIEALDGPSGAAGVVDTGDSAICNWRMRGYIPPSRHLRLLIAIRKLGLTINPALFDLTDEDLAVL